MEKMTLRDIDVQGKRVFVRVDFNVPFNEEGEVADDTRIRAALPTIGYLIDRGARVILASHLGRPKGKPDPRFSLRPVAGRLSALLGREVGFAGDCVGPAAQDSVRAMSDGDVTVLENLRFHPEEEVNDPEFAGAMASLADVYVNDAFGTAHRAHASTAGIPAHIPAVAGFLLEKELTSLGMLVSEPAPPFVAIVGGAKISDKIGVLERLMARADCLIIGGGMANTFLAAQGKDMAQSLVETDRLDVARGLLEKVAREKMDLLLPVDLVAAPSRDQADRREIVDTDSVPEGWMALDIGPRSVELFGKRIREAKTVFWNGPMGLFEVSGFDAGTQGVAEATAESDGVTIIGGGDTVRAINQAGLADRVTHLSTGGGASLKMVEGKKLPGVEALNSR
ncbi:MAG: phosphoglycerate kinase [Eubacteriales bacterium]|jgi:phosphoglycerate kinase|nr:phosphoglycerate kinase [Bacillota bacterium]MBV1727877.1 phosphoglycerate kinase [Desulforudis sp.]MDQ7789896.1 phosphoglycerate kinase [Clostridia bacterium]MDZ4043372.1 phosphoglycerate kinase [Eubacteriales bacterium]MBU4533417.1 phosphoglycerate kinase [Bacillota bacterium]